jgi:hypothetical protein
MILLDEIFCLKNMKILKMIENQSYFKHASKHHSSLVQP